jgi:hypothetical protein
MTQPLTWPFLTALAELRWLEETATDWSRKYGSYFAHSSIVTMAMDINIDLPPSCKFENPVTINSKFSLNGLR